MFRQRFDPSVNHECSDCSVTLVCVATPRFAGLDDFIDDLMSLRVAIRRMKKTRLSRKTVYEWLLTDADTLGARFADGVCVLFLLRRANGLSCLSQLAAEYNDLAIKKGEVPPLYVSADVVSAFRDARFFFPDDVPEDEILLEAARAYASSHLVKALATQVAKLQLEHGHGGGSAHTLAATMTGMYQSLANRSDNDNNDDDDYENDR